jgi:hypothetical protein
MHRDEPTVDTDAPDSFKGFGPVTGSDGKATGKKGLELSGTAERADVVGRKLGAKRGIYTSDLVLTAHEEHLFSEWLASR